MQRRRRSDRRRRVRLRSAALVALGLAVVAQASSHGESEGFPWRFEDLAEGVFAALMPVEDRFDDANSLVVIGTREVLVVDAQSNADAVRALIAEIRRRTDRPIRYVVNSHWHGDHTQGNAIYRREVGEGVAFVGHASLASDVPERAASFVTERVAQYEAALPPARERLARGLDREGAALGDEDEARLAGQIDAAEAWLAANRDATFLAPTMAYDERLTLDLGARTVELHHRVAHTEGDTVVWIPSARVLATGDMLDDLPYAGHGCPRQWIGALASLDAFDYRVAVPGHGPVFAGQAQQRAVQAYFRDLVGQVEKASAAGQDLDDLREAVDLSAHRRRLARDDTARRFFDQVRDEAIEAAFRDLQGTACRIDP